MTSISVLKLSDLARQIRLAIDGVFGNRSFWVIADISNYTYKGETNQHYFDLIEKDKASSGVVAKISGRAWGTAAVHISNFEKATGQKFKNNINVLVQVSVQYHQAFGLQLNLIDIDTNFTLGQFEQQRNLTLAKLVAENPSFIRLSEGRYITRNSELRFKKAIQYIAVISSVTSAGYQDFEHTILNNPFKYAFKLDLYLAKVQGDENAKPFLDKLIDVFNSKKDYDAIVIIRGGGAQSDFLLFDNYELSRAIAKFPIPVITGIGHQKNETIVDLMAHTATKTPTKAAELIIAHNRNFEENLSRIQKAMIIKSQQLFASYVRELNDLKTHLLKDVLRLLNDNHRNILTLSGIITNKPGMWLSNEHKNISNLLGNIKTFNSIFIAHEKVNLHHYLSIVNLMSPQNILNKGFAILKLDGKIISNTAALLPGKELIIQLSTAEINTVVKSIKNL
ncbi:exodeoxyribonuclease VII large subunit [Pedobacter immunditicola]|uniref:exodeoxyribonuclease VII large subunit n=1 Tax=Pedobacter immunditicola TaxID=3133440 RepID=UPI0030A2ABBD